MPLIVEKEIKAVQAKTVSEKQLCRKIEPDNWEKPTKYFLTLMHPSGKYESFELSVKDAKAEEDLIMAILEKRKEELGIVSVTQAAII